MKNDIPDLFIEQLLLDELPESVEGQDFSDPDIQARVEKLNASNRQILAQYPATEMSDIILTRAREDSFRQKKRSPVTRYIPVAGVAAALVLVLSMAILSPRLNSPAGDPLETTRIKGLQPHLMIYKKVDTGAELLTERTRVRESDVLQISYVSAGKKYGVIFSIDGRGAVTLHYPITSVSALDLESDGETPLTFAYQLDDAPAFERFFFIAADDIFSIDDILDQAQQIAGQPRKARAGKLELPADYEQASILLVKESD